MSLRKKSKRKVGKLAKKSKQSGKQKRRKSELNGKCTFSLHLYLVSISYYLLPEPITSETCTCWIQISKTYSICFQGQMVRLQMYWEGYHCTKIFKINWLKLIWLWQLTCFDVFYLRSMFELFFHDGDNSCSTLHHLKGSWSRT